VKLVQPREGAAFRDEVCAFIAENYPADAGARDGVRLFVVDRHSPSLDLRSFGTIDGRQAAEIALNDAIESEDSAWPLSDLPEANLDSRSAAQHAL
jgi:hypothetical protein